MHPATPAQPPGADYPELEPGSKWISTETGFTVELLAYHHRGMVDHVAIRGKKLSRGELMLPKDVFLQHYRLREAAPIKPETRNPTMKFHPLASLFPLFENDDLDVLCEDIERNGLANPVVMFEGQILDGRNRYRACKELGIEPELVNFAGTDPLAYVISQNMTRRHLSESQRAMCAARIANLRQGRPMDHGIDTEAEHATSVRAPQGPETPSAADQDEPAPLVQADAPSAGDGAHAAPDAAPGQFPGTAAAGTASDDGMPPVVEPTSVDTQPASDAPPQTVADETGKFADAPKVTQQQAADQMHVSERSVRMAKVVHDNGIRALRDAVDRGEISVSRAEKIARMLEHDQIEALQAHRAQRATAKPAYLEIPASLGLWAARALGRIDLAPCWSRELDKVLPAATVQAVPDNGADWKGNVVLVPTRRTLLDYAEQIDLALTGDAELLLLIICEAHTTMTTWQALAQRADAIAFCDPLDLGIGDAAKPSTRGLCVLAYSRNCPQPRWRQLLLDSGDVGLVVTP